MTEKSLFKSRVAATSPGRYHSFIVIMIDHGLPHGTKFLNGLLQRVNIRDDVLLKIINRYAKIAYPSSGGISPMYPVHCSIELGVLVDIALSEVASEPKARETLYRQCLPRSAQELLQLNGIEDEVMEGGIAARY